MWSWWTSTTGGTRVASGCSVARQKAACQVRPPFGAVGMLSLPGWGPPGGLLKLLPLRRKIGFYSLCTSSACLGLLRSSLTQQRTVSSALCSQWPRLSLSVPPLHLSHLPLSTSKIPPLQGLFKGFLAIRFTVHRKPFIRPPRLPEHRSPLDAPGSFVWKTKAHQQQGGFQQCDPGRTVSPTCP